jgi:hypothetical protein
MASVFSKVEHEHKHLPTLCAAFRKHYQMNEQGLQDHAGKWWNSHQNPVLTLSDPLGTLWYLAYFFEYMERYFINQF